MARADVFPASSTPKLRLMPTPDTEWLDTDQQHAWRAYIGGTTMLIDRLDRELRQAHDISLPEYEVLVRLSESPDRTRVELEHRHLDRHGDGWEGLREGVAGDQGWPLYLGRFSDLL